MALPHTNLNPIDRSRIKEDRDYPKGLFLNRAERVAPVDALVQQQLQNYIPWGEIGFYHDVSPFLEKLESYLGADKGRVLITNGADEAIKTIFSVFCGSQSTIAFPVPTYGMYFVYSKLYGCNARLLKYDKNFKLDRDSLMEALPSLTALFLPNPNHIEDIFNEVEIRDIAATLQENDGLLVMDETYYGFGSPTMLNLTNDFDNVIIIRSFSKTFGFPSLRAGCLIAHPKLMSILNAQRLAYEISFPSQKICEFFLDNISIINDYIEDCKLGRDFLLTRLNDLNLTTNGGMGYLINFKAPVGLTSEKISEKLKQKNIFVGSQEGLIRVTSAPIAYMRKLIKELEFILESY